MDSVGVVNGVAVTVLSVVNGAVFTVVVNGTVGVVSDSVVTVVRVIVNPFKQSYLERGYIDYLREFCDT